MVHVSFFFFFVIFFFNDTATTEIYTLSLHDALPISEGLMTQRGAIDILHRNETRIHGNEEFVYTNDIRVVQLARFATFFTQQGNSICRCRQFCRENFECHALTALLILGQPDSACRALPEFVLKDESVRQRQPGRQSFHQLTDAGAVSSEDPASADDVSDDISWVDISRDESSATTKPVSDE